MSEALAHLDPQDWKAGRQLAHQMVDDMWDYLESLRDRPVWQPTSASAKTALQSALPQQPAAPEQVYADFLEQVLPFNKGNVHPHFWSWVQGTGTPMAMMYEMLAAGLNPNATIGDHAARYVEQQVIDWLITTMGFPQAASGLLVSGASMANVTALIIARDRATQGQAKTAGLAKLPTLTVYCSTETHSCVRKAVQACGIGVDQVRAIAVDEQYRIQVDQLQEQIQRDRAAGYLPCCIVGNAGTVNVGSFDPLAELREIATAEQLWFHVDGAFGALATWCEGLISAEVKAGLQAADSLAFDLHKWGCLPYELGCLLVHDRAQHRESFAYQPSYLHNHERGLAAGPDPESNYGLELSRGFKALKVWMHFKEHGFARLAAVVRRNVEDAQYFASLVKTHPELELVGPHPLNIVCYRYRFATPEVDEQNQLNRELLMRLHETGSAAPSYTTLGGHYVIRMCNVNQRSLRPDFDHLLQRSVELGRALAAEHV